jgi:predicted RNA binding protein YcfA (HicA-like mRNA interferase family)
MEHLNISLAPRHLNRLLRPRSAVRRWPPAKENGMSSSNRMKEARRELERRGFTATKTRGGHWRFEHPDMPGPVFAPDAPSDRRGIKNLHALLRRKMRSGR